MLQPAPLQTTYNQYGIVAQVGAIARNNPEPTIDTRFAEDPSGAQIPFGRAVCGGTVSDKAATLGALSGGTFIGITVAKNDGAVISGVTVDKYNDKDNMPVLVEGDIWVAPATSVAAGGAVYYNSSTGQLGASGISNAVLIHNARWLDSKPNTDETNVNFNNLARVRLGSSAAY